MSQKEYIAASRLVSRGESILLEIETAGSLTIETVVEAPPSGEPRRIDLPVRSDAHIRLVLTLSGIGDTPLLRRRLFEASPVLRSMIVRHRRHSIAFGVKTGIKELAVEAHSLNHLPRFKSSRLSPDDTSGRRDDH